MPGDYRLVGVTRFWETLSVLNVGNGEELWRYVVGSSECALESPITLSPRGTHFAYSLCGHVVHTHRVGKKPGPAIAHADGCGEKHVWAHGFSADGSSLVAGSGYWRARFDTRSGATLDRYEVAEVAYPVLMGEYVFWTVDGRATQVMRVASSEVVLDLDDLGEPTTDGRYFIGTDAIYEVATGKRAELSFDLLLHADY
jgi:hypothetical protein